MLLQRERQDIVLYMVELLLIFLSIRDLTTYSDAARYFYKLRDRDVKDKNIIIQRTLNTLKGTWLNCNPKLVLIPEKSLYAKLSQFYVISWNGTIF